jgi:prepilin-type processing-associated H-X9-DG protein
MGTSGNGTIGGNPAWTGNRQHNLTTVMWPIGTKLAVQNGMTDNLGVNMPIQSSHSGGAQVLMGDASVRFLNDSLAMITLRQLATRDDGYVNAE